MNTVTKTSRIGLLEELGSDRELEEENLPPQFLILLWLSICGGAFSFA